jgi:hypothetical protein
MRPVEGIRASGGSGLQVIRFAVLPQVAANFASYGLLRFEINVRGASVMGFVGAGGIGQELLTSIRQFYYSDVSAILLLSIVDDLRHRSCHPAGSPRASWPYWLDREITMTDVAQSLSREAHAHEKELRAEYADLFGNGRTWRNLAIFTVALIASVWFAFYWLDFSLLRILNGLGRLGDFVLMRCRHRQAGVSAFICGR